MIDHFVTFNQKFKKEKRKKRKKKRKKRKKMGEYWVKIGVLKYGITIPHSP